MNNNVQCFVYYLYCIFNKKQDWYGEKNRPKYNEKVYDCVAVNIDKGTLIPTKTPLV